MEQQTVSVAKAGITTTLNARTCILAAANPVMGRWNPKLSPEKNLGLAPALLSRFDLTFKILDKPDEDFDRSLAMHVCHVHRLERHPELDFEPYSPAFLRAYISKARTFEPFVPEGLADHIVGLYVGLRKGDQDQDNTKYLDKTTNKRARFCTARTLLSILRLSQALARIRFHQVVSEDHVEEAMNLLVSSKNADDDGVAHRQGPADDTAAVFHIFTDLGVNQRKHHIKVAQARQIAVTRGFSEKAVDAVLEMYENLGVWQVTSNRQEVQFLPGQLNIA
jgi:DNA replication licensing factor MCM7